MKRRVGITLLLLLLSAPALAQYDDDQQTRDHEELDRRYQEHYAEEPAMEADADHGKDAEAFLARAEALIRDKNYRSAQSARYRVQSDDPDVDADASAVLLEGFRSFFDRFWTDRIELADYEPTSRVFLFYSFRKFNQLLAVDFRFSENRPKGHYGWAFDVVTLHTDPDGAGELADVLVHEAAHQLVDHRIYGGRAMPSPWVSEGLATYFGHSYRDPNGLFHPGIVGHKSVELRQRKGHGQGKESALRMRAFREASRASSKRGDLPLVERVVRIDDPQSFYSEPTENYATSWLLVHFLLHGEEGRHAKAFANYLGLEVRGSGGPEALFGELGLQPAQLQDALERHVKNIESR